MQMAKFNKLLRKVVLHDEDDDSVQRLPELYYVPYDKVYLVYSHWVDVQLYIFLTIKFYSLKGVLVFRIIFVQTDMEYQHPHSQDRCSGKKRQTMWAQSLFILGGLLSEVGVASSLVWGGAVCYL